MVQQGVDNACFEKGLENWRARHPEKVLDVTPEEKVLDATPEETACVA